MILDEKVKQLTTEGYEFKLGQYLTDGYEYFKAQAGIFIGFFVLSIIMVIVASFIPLVGSLASQILSLIFFVGYFIVCNKIKLAETVSFDDFFKGFSSIGQIAIIQLILTGFSIVLLMPLLLFGASILFRGIFKGIKANALDNPQSLAELEAFFYADGLIPLVIITVILFMFMQTIYTFAAANTHFFKVGSWEAMEASRKVIQKKFFQFFALFLVIALINILGTLCLFVGLLVTVPMSYAIFYAAFDDIMRPNNEHLIEEDHSFEDRSN